MRTPICDFVREYAEKDALRLHMPGHKGQPYLGCEALDITEINGADSLYEAAGIIRESERNASALFGCETYYSTEGSSQCIRAMLFLAMQYAHKKGKKPLIAAARNVHKTFLSAAALLDLDVVWIYPEAQGSYLSCVLRAEQLERVIAQHEPVAVYLTSPDYLGNVADIRAIAQACHRHDTLLLTDNAHGAYLRFTKPSLHPIDLGADLCCDSAHKTLPVLTGGAYLHCAARFLKTVSNQTKTALALFGSTSPSYLILQSLDSANAYLENGYSEKLTTFAEYVETMKKRLVAQRYVLCGNEPLKLTLNARAHGYCGTELLARLERENIYCEFADADFLVMMFTPEQSVEELGRVFRCLCRIPKRENLRGEDAPVCFEPERVLSVREAMLAPSEELPTERSIGRILASPTVGCPPAVPILVSGERIDEAALACFRYYGISHCRVVAQ